MDAELTGVQGVWMIEKLRRRDPRCPVIVYTGAKQPEWEEEAYLQGVSHVLTKPVRMRVLNSILERLLKAPAAAPAPAPPPAILEMQKPAEPSAFTGVSSLNILRDFSSILTHSLDAEALLRQFLLQLRELMSINRAAIFLDRKSVV